MKYWVLISLFSFLVYAQEDTSIYVHTYDDVNGGSLQKEGIVVTKGTPKGVSYFGALPHPSKMKEMVKTAQLQEELKNFDEMDLDILFERLKLRPLREVKAKYSHLDSSKLEKLAELIKGLEK